MKKILVCDWEEGNPYYQEINKKFIDLKFNTEILPKINYEEFSGVISHYAPSYFVQKFSKKIEKDFPIIQYRCSDKEIEMGKKWFEIYNLPLDNLHRVNTPKELGALIKKLFPEN